MNRDGCGRENLMENADECGRVWAVVRRLRWWMALDGRQSEVKMRWCPVEWDCEAGVMLSA